MEKSGIKTSDQIDLGIIEGMIIDNGIAVMGSDGLYLMDIDLEVLTPERSRKG